MPGMSTMYDVHRPLDVEVQKGSHKGKCFIYSAEYWETTSIKGVTLLSLMNNNACITYWPSLTKSMS